MTRACCQIEKDSKYSWCVMVSIFLAISLGVALPMHGSISVNVHSWIHGLGLSEAQVGWVSSLLNLFFLSLGPVYNFFTQTIGLWKAQIVAGLLTAIGLICTAFSTQSWHLILSYSFLAGMGSAMSQVNSFTAVKTYFDRHRTKAFSLSYAGNSCGQLLGPIVTDFLMNTVQYRYTFFVQAGIVLIVTVTAALFYRGDGSGEIFVEDKAKTSDADTDNKLSVISDGKINTEEDSSENSSNTSEISSQNSSLSNFKQLARQQAEWMRNIYFILALISYFLAGMVPAIFLTYIIEYGERAGYATSSQGAVGQAIFGGAALGSALLTTALMRFNRWPVILHSAVIASAGVVMICLPSVHSLAGHFTVCFFIGACEAVMVSNMMSHAQTFGSDQIDIRVAYLFAFCGFGYVLGPIIAGSIIKPLGMESAFYVGGGFSVAAILFMVPAAIKNHLNRSQQHDSQQ